MIFKILFQILSKIRLNYNVGNMGKITVKTLVFYAEISNGYTKCTKKARIIVHFYCLFENIILLLC